MHSKFLLIFAIIIVFFSCEETKNEYPSYPEKKKVLIIGIDGALSNAFQESTGPYIYSLKNSENVRFNLSHKVEDLTISGPNWASICTGVHYDKHKVRDNFFENNDLESYPHFFNYLNDYYGDEQIELASIAHWFPINYFMTIHQADYGPVDFNYSDDEVFEQSMSLLENKNPIDPDVLFIHFDQLDHFGHASGFDVNNPEYATAISNVDSYTSALMTAVEKRINENGEEWLTIIVSDHGGDGTVHAGGANNAAINQTILMIHHPDMPENVSLNTSEQVDIAPTILHFLEVDYSTFNLDGKNLLP